MGEENQRAYEAVMGSLVADAASLGFHWLYDQELIARYGGKHPEFHQTNREEYQGKGYFAHIGKQVGDYSNYGAQMLAMQEAIALNGGYDELAYIKSFQHWFDFGGSWQGYIDHATRGTLLNLYQLKANDEPLTVCGTDDTENPALSKLPPLVAAHYQDPDLMAKVVSAVRVTNNNDTSVAYGKAAAVMLQSAITGASLQECVQRAKATDAIAQAAIEKAESMIQQDSLSVAAQVGMDCRLNASFVVICHLLLNAKSYQQVIRDNILCGGDNCGRGVTLGAILAASFYGTEGAMPSLWVSQTHFPAAKWRLPSALSGLDKS